MEQPLPSAELQPIEHVSLAHEVYGALHRQIVLGQLRPGDRLDVAALARTLRVSTMPVKQAVARLQLEGFVEIQPRRGTFVTSLSKDDLLESLDVRLALDLFVAERIAETIPTDILDEMRLVHEQMQALSVETGDYYQRQVLDRQFHRLPIVALGNQRIIQIHELQHTHAQLARVQGSQVRWDRADRDHAAILAAFERHDAAAARLATVAHAQHARETLVTLMTRTEDTRAAT